MEEKERGKKTSSVGGGVMTSCVASNSRERERGERGTKNA